MATEFRDNERELYFFQLRVGIAGAVFCVAAQFRARDEAKERLRAADKLVERLERLAEADADTVVRLPPDQGFSKA